MFGIILAKKNFFIEILAYYRHERIVEDIAFYSQQLLLTTDGGYAKASKNTSYDLFYEVLTK